MIIDIDRTEKMTLVVNLIAYQTDGHLVFVSATNSVDGNCQELYLETSLSDLCFEAEHVVLI